MRRALAALSAAVFTFAASAANLAWDADTATPGAQDGAGTWTAVDTNWWDGTAHTNWTDATPDTAVIGVDQGAAGTISLDAPHAVQALNFSRSISGSYVITNGALTIGAGGISMAPYTSTNKLLDTISTPAAGAWSLRKLRTGYAGPVVTVRRPSDNVTTDVYFDATGFLDTNALALFLGTETGTVARWYDQSGNGRDGVQATAANQPQLDKPNGKWAVLGRGNQWLIATNCTVGQMVGGGSNGTAALLYRAQSASQATFGWYQSTSSDMRWSAHLNWNDGASTLYFDPGSVAGARVSMGDAINNGVWQQYTLIRSNAAATIRWGGMERITAAGRSGACTTSATQWGVMGAVNTPGPAYGDMAEYLQFATPLSGADVRLVESSQGAAFGVGALDVVDVAAAGAWSLRKLRSAYTGPALNVRRPSDSATTDIYFGVNGFLDTNALALFLPGETGTVARWYDQSGNGRDGVQATAANQPQLDKPNGKWAILGRANQWLYATNCTVGQMTMGGSNGTVALVWRALNANGQATFGWYDASTRWSAHVNHVDGTLYWDPGNAAGARVQVGNGGNTGVWQQYTLIRSNGYGAIRWAGVDRVVNTTRAGAITATGTQWGVLSAVGTANRAQGDMTEYIQFANGLGPTNLLALEANQAAAYGTLTTGILGPSYFATVASPVTMQVAQAWTASNGAVLAVSGDVDNNGQALTVNGDAFVNVSGPIHGAGALSKIGTGTLTLAGSAANTYTGLTTLTNGLLALAKTGGAVAVPGDFTGDNTLSPRVYTKANNQFGAGSVMRFTGTVGDYVRFELLGTTQTLAGVDNAASTTRGVIQQRELVPDASIGTASELVLAGGGAYGFNGFVRNTGGSLAVTKTGSGTQLLAGANITYTGQTLVVAGALVLSNANAFASPISNAAVVEFADSAVGFASRSLTGPGLWLKTGIGTQHVNGAANAPIAPSGQILVQQGVLQNNNNNVNWSNNLAVVDVAAGAALDLYADPILVPAVTGPGVVRSTFGNAANYSGIASNTERLTIGLTNASSVFAGTLTDTGTNGVGVGKGFLELMKVGSGTLTLSGTNTFNGATLIAGGTLALAASGTLSNSALLSVSNGAVLDVTAAGAIALGTNQALGGAGTVLGSVVAQAGSRLVPGADTAAAPVGTLAVAGDVSLHAASTNVYHLGGATNAGGAFNDLVVVTGNLEPSNSVVRVEPLAPLANGAYRLFTYGGTKTTLFNPAVVSGGAGLGRKGAYIDESTLGQVNLVVTGAYGALVWLPQTNALWNGVDANWSNTVAAALDFYTALDEVLFDESGAYSNAVTIPAAVTPSLVTVAGASNYTFAGAAIAGVGSVVKTGAGTLTVLNTNTYSGPTTISGGLLHLGDGGVINNLGGTPYINVTNAGTLSMYATAGRTVEQAIRGNGTWLMRGPGVSGQGEFSPTNDNSLFSGTIISTNCRFTVNSPLDVGAAAAIVAQDRGQFWLSAGTNDRPVVIAGLGWQEGAGQLGAIRLSSATNSGPVTLAAYARIGTYSGGERGVLNGNISGPYTLELWNGNGGYTFLNGTNTFASLNLYGGWHYFGNSSALGSGPIAFNGGGLSAYPGPLVVTNPVQPGVIAMHIGNDLGFLPVTVANTITITNTHVDAYIYNTTTVVGAFNGGGTKGIYKYAAGELRLAGTNALGWVECVQAGTVSYVSNSVTTLSGNFNFRAGSTMNLFDSAQVEANESFIGTSASGNWGTLNVYGGRLRLNNAGTEIASQNRVLIIGEYSGAASYVNLYGGELNVTSGLARTFLGWAGSGYLRVHGGQALLRTLRAAGQGGGIDLDGGELRVGTGGIDWTGGPQPVINLGGGTLGAMDNWACGIPMSVNGTNGNTQVNGMGYTIGLSGAMTGTGGLAKVGSGTLALNGTYSAGPVAVSGGTLGGTGTVNAAVAVSAGAALQPGYLTGAGALTASTVTFAANSALSVLANGTDSVLRVAATNGLALPAGASVATVNVQNASLLVGTYTVIDYAGAIQGGDATNLVLGTLPPRAVMYLTNNAGNTSIDLVVVTASEPIKWVGNVSGSWNIGSPTNWVTTIGGVPTAYLEAGGLGDALLFDDTAAGNFTIALAANVAPSAFVANHTANDYTIGGGFGIGGNVGLQKSGEGRLVLASSNSFAGGAFLAGGTLQLGDGATAGTAGSGGITNNAAVVFNYPQTGTVANVISGTGGVAQAGAGQVTLSAASTYSGPTLVNAGRLVIAGAISPNSPVTVVTGAVLSLTGSTALGNSGNTLAAGVLLVDGGVASADGPAATVEVLNGGLVLRDGGTLAATAVPNANQGNFILYSNAAPISSTGEVQNLISAEVHVAGPHAIDVYDGASDVDLLISGRLSHYQGSLWGGIVKTGPGTLKLTCPSNAIAGTTLNGGRVVFAAGGLGWQDLPANKIGYYLADFAGDTVLAWDGGNTQDITTNGNVRIQNAAVAMFDTGTNSVSLANPIVASGTANGTLVKAGAGTLALQAANAFGGLVTISNGALLVQGSVTGAVSVDTAGTLGGTGVIKGAVTQFGTVAPGAGIGVLTVSNVINCTGTAVTRIELGATNSYDQLVCSDIHSLAGKLEVVLTNAYAPAAGDAFTVVQNTGAGGLLIGLFDTTSLPALGGGLGWDVAYSPAAVTLTVTGAVYVPTPYEAWAAQIPNPALRGDQEDADGDGYANLWEYSQGTDPTNGASGLKVRVSRTNGVHYILFNRATNAVDLMYEVEAADLPTNNATWSMIASNLFNGGWSGTSAVSETPTGDVRQVSAADDASASTNRTMRVRVIRP